MNKVQIHDSTLYLGDSLEIMQELDSVDSVVTDPPYGVNLGLVKNGQAKDKQQQSYTVPDTPEYIEKVVVPIIELCREKSNHMAVTCGKRNMWKYPEPDDQGVWWNPASTSRGKWGWNLVVTPILYYGKDPRAGRMSTASSVDGHTRGRGDKVDHPCPKPIGFMNWLVNKASLEGHTVLDPFMGSGTTGVACAQMGRKFIGIEIEPKYFDIACERIERAYQQQDMFRDNPEPLKQVSMI